MEKSKNQLSYTQVAWVAGFFDGEGTVTCTNGHGEGVMSCAVVNTNYLSVDRLYDWFGGRVHIRGREGNLNWRPIKRWIVSSRQALHFALIIQSYTFVKTEQLNLLIEFYAGKLTAKESWYLSVRETRRRKRIFLKLHELNRRGVK